MALKLNTKQMIELLGGVKAVAKKLNISVQAVSQWDDNIIPVSKMVMIAALIEKESHGLVTRQDMFPKSWMWIWPELLEKTNAFGLQQEEDIE